MKFVVEQIGGKGGRIGRISGLRSQPETSHETPLFLVSTVGGSAPHLTQDNLHRVVEKQSPICVPAQHFCDHTNTLQAFSKGVAQFAALKTHSVCVTVQDPATMTPSGYNDKNGVSIWSNRGRLSMTPQKYMTLVKAMQPDWYETLNDADTDEDSSNKRMEKSMANSTYMLQHCIEIHKGSESLQKASLFVPLLGGHSEYKRTKWSKGVVEGTGQEHIKGFSVLGIHTNGSTAEDVKPHLASSLVKASLSVVPSNLPRQSLGAWNPLTIICLAEVGIDIFDSSYPFLVTERKGVLTFPNKLESKHQEKGSNDSLDHQDKKLKTEAEANGSEKDSPTQSSPYEFSIEDVSNFDVKEPLVEGCECYSCKSFTRSYIHHLVNVKEMLAPVLLIIHNLHHWNIFFQSIREAIKKDELSTLKEALESSVHET